MRGLRAIAAALLLCGPALTPALAVETVDYQSETPLIVIRFNQYQVDYKMPLYNTLSAALKAKPEAVFDIVTVAPKTEDPTGQEHYTGIAKRNTHQVLVSMYDMGIPASRISVVNAVDTIPVNETRIYVH